MVPMTNNQIYEQALRILQNSIIQEAVNSCFESKQNASDDTPVKKLTRKLLIKYVTSCDKDITVREIIKKLHQSLNNNS